MVSRGLIGASAANYAVGTTFLSRLPTGLRPKIMAYNGAVTVFGYIGGPAVAVGLSFADFTYGKIRVDSTTAPSYFTALLAIITIIPTIFLLLRVVRQQRTGRARRKRQMYNSMSFTSASFPSFGMLSSGTISSFADVSALITAIREDKRVNLPLVPVIICFGAYFVLTVAFSVWETAGSIVSEKKFGWGVFENGVMFAGMGVVAIGTLGLVQLLAQYVAERLLLIGSILLMVNTFCYFSTFCITNTHLLVGGWTSDIDSTRRIQNDYFRSSRWIGVSWIYCLCLSHFAGILSASFALSLHVF
jgi:hypothetical protein